MIVIVWLLLLYYIRGVLWMINYIFCCAVLCGLGVVLVLLLFEVMSFVTSLFGVEVVVSLVLWWMVFIFVFNGIYMFDWML